MHDHYDVTRNFPVLGVYRKTRLVVLFNARTIGTVVDPGKSKYKIGTIADDWDPKWKTYFGKVHLFNPEFYET